jgi:Skp family chaperone for outer membrane proteins
VRKLSLSAVVFGLASLSLCSLAQAQPAGGAVAPAYQSGANAPRFGIAVVDISFLFQQYPKFTSSMEALKAEMKAADEALTKARDAIVQREQQRDREFKPGSEEFKRLDEQIAHDKAEFQIKTGTLRRDIADKEAKIYFETYTDISGAIATYARSNNIGLVLRFVGDQVDPEQQKDIMRAVSQQILFQNNIDITPHIRDILFASSGQAQRTQQQATRPAATRR